MEQMEDELRPESEKFYKKLFSLINLNQALVLSGYQNKYLCDMSEKEYHEYLIKLEYLNQRGIIDLDSILGNGTI
jgi:succinate dehydrogenase flavin-adding protein (antitoxin of CptAB toxin-antitoxin module)